MSSSDQQFDAALRDVPLPPDLLSGLKTLCATGNLVRVVAEREEAIHTTPRDANLFDASLSEAAVDAALCAVTPPAGLFARVKRMALADELEWLELGDALRGVEPPQGLSRRLAGIARPLRGPVGWWNRSGAISLVVAACGLYFCATLIFLLSNVRAPSGDPDYFVLERPLLSPADVAVEVPHVFARFDLNSAEEKPAEDERRIVLHDPQPSTPPSVGLPDPVTAFDAFQRQVASILVSYPWESPLRDVPDVLASPIGEGPDPEIVPWLPTGLSAGLEPPPYRGFDGAFLYRHDEWPVVSLDRNTDARLHVCRVPLRIGSDSFELTRRYLEAERPRRPPPEEIRKEDFLASLDYDFASVRESAGQGLAVRVVGGPSPFSGPGTYLLQVGVQAPETRLLRSRAAHLVLVIDVSQSMSLGDRLGLLRRALGDLPRELAADDRVSLVLFNDGVETSSETFAAGDESPWQDALARLAPRGGTNLVAALRAAYRLAGPPGFNPDGVDRRLVLITDGLSPLDDFTLERLHAAAQAAAQGGVTLDVADVSPSSRQDNGQLEALATAGGGRLARLGQRHELRGFVLEALRGSSHVAASQVELSVTFNPAMVRAYRQIGHEPSRARFLQLAPDTVEQGAVFWSGQQATALFEIELWPSVPGGGAEMSLLRDNVATAYVTWVTPAGEQRRHLEQLSQLQLARTFRESAPCLQMAAVAAEAAEILADSNYAPRTTLADVLAVAESADQAARSNRSFVDFLKVVKAASQRAKVRRR